MKSLTAKAKILGTDIEVEGGVCSFIDPKDGKEHCFMIHPDQEGKPTVSKVEVSSVIPVWSCWDWMDGWLKAYEASNPKGFSHDKFKQWLNSQPMCA